MHSQLIYTLLPIITIFVTKNLTKLNTMVKLINKLGNIMNENAYELSHENKIQLRMNEYGRPDHGLAMYEVKNLNFTKEQIDKAIDTANEVSEKKKLEVSGYDLHHEDKQEIINIYAGEAFLKILNFDIIFNDKINVEQEIFPKVFMVGYGYFDNNEQNKKRTECEIEINHHLLDLAKVIVKDHYGRVKMSNFEELKINTKTLNTENLLQKVHQIRSVQESSDLKIKI